MTKSPTELLASGPSEWQAMATASPETLATDFRQIRTLERSVADLKARSVRPAPGPSAVNHERVAEKIVEIADLYLSNGLLDLSRDHLGEAAETLEAAFGRTEADVKLSASAARVLHSLEVRQSDSTAMISSATSSLESGSDYLGLAFAYYQSAHFSDAAEALRNGARLAGEDEAHAYEELAKNMDAMDAALAQHLNALQSGSDSLNLSS